MLAKLKRVFAAALVLIAGGMGIRAALRQASIDESMNCAEWQTVLDSIENRPEYIPLYKIIKQDCAGVTANIKCAEMPSGRLCRNGYLVGPGDTSNLPPLADKSTPNTCDASLGEPIPCTSTEGGRWWKRVRDGNYDKKRLFNKVKRLIDAR